MSSFILDKIDESIGKLGGSLLTVVQDPFRFPPFYYAVYLAPVEKVVFDNSYLDPVADNRTVSYKELDEWMSSFVNGVTEAIWPIASRTVVDVLYRERSFLLLSLVARECISARYFDPSRYNPMALSSTLASVMGPKDPGHLTDFIPLVTQYLMRYATAIHFLKTGDIETNLDVLRGQFLVDGLNIMSINVVEDGALFVGAVFEKMNELHAELKGAHAISRIDWEADITKLLDLGRAAMMLRATPP